MRCIFLIYITTIVVNLFDSIKYPDYLEAGLINLIVSLVFLISIIVYVLYQVKNNDKDKRIDIFLITATLSGILIYIIVSFYDFMFNNMIVDVISNIQFPLYILFITPLFGLNYILNINYDLLSLVISGIYFIIYLVNLFLYKDLYQKR